MSDLKATCPNCGKIYTPDLAHTSDFEDRYAIWRGGVLIQRVWPDATPDQREQLQTGICSDKCWNEFLGVSDED